MLFEVYCEIYLEIQVSDFSSFFEFREVFSGLVNPKNHFDTFLIDERCQYVWCAHEMRDQDSRLIVGKESRL